MNTLQLKSVLGKKIAFLPGCRDRDGGPIIIFPSQGEWKEYPYQEVVSVLGYLAQIPEDKCRTRGFTVIIDMRNAWIKYLKTILKACQHVLYRLVRQVLIVKPEQFLEKQKISIDLMIEAYELKVTTVSVHKLSRHVDITQLPQFLGGTYPYDHEKWMDIREKYEEFVKEGSSTLRKMKGENSFDDSSSVLNGLGSSDDISLHRNSDLTVETSIDSLKINETTKKGHELLSELRGEEDNGLALKSPNPDFQLASHRVETLLRQIKERMEISRNSYQEKEKEERSRKLQTDHALYDHFSTGVDNLCDWLLGPGEKWLLTLHEIGESKDEAEQLTREHDQLDSKAQEVAMQVSDLRGMADKLMEIEHPRAVDIRRKRDYMEKTSKTFMSRVKRQNEMVHLSVRFHELLNSVSGKLDEMLEGLLSEAVVSDINTAQTALEHMDAKLETIDKSYQEVTDTGHHFIEQLKYTEQNSLGHEVTRDYSAGVVHVRECLSELKARKLRCGDLADVRRLKLQQLQQLYTCERDAEQAIKWIEELTATLNQQTKIGSSTEEALKLKQDQQKLEHTARSSYEYGKQLMQVSLVLRRTLRLELGSQLALARRLEDVWSWFCRGLSERATRLSIGSTFYTTVQQVNARLEDLCLKVGTEVQSQNIDEKDVFSIVRNGGSSFMSSSARPAAVSTPIPPAPGPAGYFAGYAGSAQGTAGVKGNSLEGYDAIKKQLGVEVKELRCLAETLISRMEEPVTANALVKDPGPGRSVKKSAGSDRETVREIRQRLAQVETKQEQLEKYWAEPSNYLVKDVRLSDVRLNVRPKSPE